MEKDFLRHRQLLSVRAIDLVCSEQVKIGEVVVVVARIKAKKKTSSVGRITGLSKWNFLISTYLASPTSFTRHNASFIDIQGIATAPMSLSILETIIAN